MSADDVHERDYVDLCGVRRPADTGVSTGDFYERVYGMVRRVPPGRVTTYGDIALALGMPRHARFVGHAMARCPDGGSMPAHRVVNHQGGVSRAWNGGHPEEQAALLRAEGVTFTREGRVDLRRHIHDLLGRC